LQLKMSHSCEKKRADGNDKIVKYELIREYKNFIYLQLYLQFKCHVTFMTV